MAERRMFAKAVVLSDAFLDLPARVRCLYFLMAMTADDDGFVNSPKSMLRQCGAKAADLKLLEQQGFVICFDSGVVVIRHWLVHNRLQKDRYKSTAHLQEMAQLQVDEQKIYEKRLCPEWTQNGSNLDTQDRKEKEREVQDSIGQERDGSFCPPTLEQVSRYCQQRTSPVSPQRFVDYYNARGWKSGTDTMGDWQAVVREWEKKERLNGRVFPRPDQWKDDF